LRELRSVHDAACVAELVHTWGEFALVTSVILRFLFRKAVSWRRSCRVV
jgi:hypothetical protein